MKEVLEYLENNDQQSIDELIEFLKIPSISADPAYNSHVDHTAQWLVSHLKDIGIQRVRKYETKGHPIVYGEHKVDERAPTVLLYGHYDVQPPDPLELWDTSPFEPEIRKTEIHPEGAIFARGACDDKGQLFAQVKALQALIANNALTCNIKIMYEGEEEVGSVNLEQFCRTHQEMLSNDVILISDTAIIAKDVPSIDHGLRGLSYVEVEVTGPNRDLHSGVYGGAVANPINVLARMIDELIDQQGCITIPGFYDTVRSVSEDERSKLNARPFSENEYMKDLGVHGLSGEAGYTAIERASIRPSLDVNGIWGGYTGEGAKTVLPSKAFAKISMRLVPDQDPDKITQLFIDYFRQLAPESVQVVVTPHHGGHPVLTPIDSEGYKAAEKAMEKTFGKKPIPTRGGGSIPIVAMFEQILNSKSVLLGFGLDSDALHSPNEHFGLYNYRKAKETLPWFFYEFSMLKK